MSTLDEFGVDVEDPWKSKQLLEGLYHDDDLNQTEIAEHFTKKGHDVTPPTISYWMRKLEIDTSHTTHDSSGRTDKAGECVRCDGETVNENMWMCSDCLDEVRAKDRENEKI